MPATLPPLRLIVVSGAYRTILGEPVWMVEALSTSPVVLAKFMVAAFRAMVVGPARVRLRRGPSVLEVLARSKSARKAFVPKKSSVVLPTASVETLPSVMAPEP